MKVSDVVTGFLLGIFGIAILLYSRTFPEMPGQNVGPSMFPSLIGAGFIICAVLLVRGGLASQPHAAWFNCSDEFRSPRNVLRFLLVPLVLVLYLAFSDYLGFIVVSMILLLALCLAFGVRPLTAVAVAVLGALCIHYLFYRLLEVPLPWGLLEPIAW